MPAISAADLIAVLTDAGSYRSWDEAPDLDRPGDDTAYGEQRRRAADRSGADESVVTGSASIDGFRVAIVASEFGYLAGSIGLDAANRIIGAYERAADEELPIIALPISGGTRMQEGTPAFLRMAGIAAAAAEHRRRGLPSLVLLRGPTTGGVLATWASLGQVSVAEPGALIGFLGPRVFQELMGRPFPPGIQQAEHLADVGIIDRVLPIDQWSGAAADLLRTTAGRPDARPAWSPPAAAPKAPAPQVVVPPAAPHPDPAAWGRVEATRSAGRPGAVQWLDQCAGSVWRLSGSGAGDRASGLLIGLADLGGRGVVVVAQDRQAQAAGELIGPWSLRGARRAMRLAQDLGLPLVTIVDTPGAELSPSAEEGAMAGEIARCLADLALLPVPTVSLLLGQGTGGGAIALLPCDRVIAAENGWVTPLPPEGAAAIVHRDAGRAPEMAAAQQITAGALAAAGAVDAVVPERGEWLRETGHAVAAALDDLGAQPTVERLRSRRARWRSIGG